MERRERGKEREREGRRNKNMMNGKSSNRKQGAR